MEEYRLGLYEKALPARLGWGEKLFAARECGFDWLEISIDESDEKLARLSWGADDLAALRGAIQATGCPVHTLCLSGHRRFPLGSRQAAVRQKALEIMEKAVWLAAQLGVRIIQLAGYDVYYEDGDGQTREHFLEGLQKCTEMAAVCGVMLGFETMETPFMDTVAKAMEYVRWAGSPYLGVYPDIGNLSNAALLYGHDALADLRTGNGHILAAHLKETKPGQYRDLWYGQGAVNFGPALACLWDAGVRMFTGEFWYLEQEDWRRDTLNAASFLRQHLGGANRQ